MNDLRLIGRLLRLALRHPLWALRLTVTFIVIGPSAASKIPRPRA